MLRNLWLFVWCCFLLFLSCRQDSRSTELDRPHDPWVFNSILDGIPNAITLALDVNLWVAYSTVNGALYKAWKGWVLFEEPNHNTKNGQQPVTIGDAFIVNMHQNPWLVKIDEKLVTYQYEYKGHKFNGPHVFLIHELQLDDGTKIRIDEQVEYTEKQSGQKGLERVFTVKNIPQKTELGLKINVSSIIVENHVETDGNWELVDKKNMEIGERTVLKLDGILWMKNEAQTKFITYFTEEPMIQNLTLKGTAEIEDPNLSEGARLIAQHDCRTCHNDLVKTVGPAYKDVAKKYKNNEGTVNLLVSKVIQGGSGIWGTQQMNAHPNLSEAKARTMIQYILNMESGDKPTNSENSIQDKQSTNQKNMFEGVVSVGNSPNQLTSAEAAAGWKLLFDGKSFEKWRGYKMEKVGDVWFVEDGAMTMDTIIMPNGKSKIEGQNDIITKSEFENFELKLEWKIQNCGNSGIFFLVQELEEYNAVYFSGPEMQILDDVCHPDGEYPKHRAGCLFDMLKCKIESVKPAGEWNQIRLVVDNGKVEHWQNGYKVVEYELWNQKWDEMIANSKFKDWPMAKTRKGHIALQDHDDKVWFRNIKIREL